MRRKQAEPILELLREARQRVFDKIGVPAMPKHPEEFQDTDPRAMEVWLDLQRRMTPEEKPRGGVQAD